MIVRYDVSKKRGKVEKISSFDEFSRQIGLGHYVLEKCDPIVEHKASAVAALLHAAYVSRVYFCCLFDQKLYEVTPRVDVQ